MAEKFAAQSAWAELIKLGRHLEVPPVAMWTYDAPMEYVQDLAQMKALGFEVETDLADEDGSREVTYLLRPVYHRGRELA